MKHQSLIYSLYGSEILNSYEHTGNYCKLVQQIQKQEDIAHIYNPSILPA